MDPLHRISEEGGPSEPARLDLARARKQAASQPRPRARKASLRVLLVDRSHDYAREVEDMLGQAHFDRFELRSHSSLASARGDLITGEIDCLLLDLALPDAAGLEALTRVQDVAPEIPVVLLGEQESEGLAMQAMHEGAQDYLVKRQADGHLLARAIRYAIDRKQGELELARQALHDSLTGLPNRMLFVDRVENALARAERTGHMVAVMYVDLDKLASVNENVGRTAGDRVLQQVVRRLEGLIRPSDTLARLGDEAFLVMCDGLQHERQALLVAERLGARMAEPFNVDSQDLPLGSAIGIAFGRDRDSTPEGLVRDAEEAMTHAKQHASRYAIADGGAASRAARRLSTETELRRAVEREELLLHYQPEVDLNTKRITGVEALLRWQHPDRGTLGPDTFIPAAEENGLILPLGEWVIENACRQLENWRSRAICPPDMIVSVNISLRQLADPSLRATIESALRASGLPAENLRLEVAETVVAGDLDEVGSRLERVKSLGIQIGLDDFGTGMSSLTALERYPLDLLKIDRSFVARLGEGVRQRRIFAAMVGIAQAVGLQAIGNGVEGRDQLEQLASAGCDGAQGFFLGRPEPAESVAPNLLVVPAHPSL